jgi:hypothetical protein
VEKSIIHIVRKHSFIFPYLLHLYQYYMCINEAEEDALTIADVKMAYKLGPEVVLTESGSEESSEGLAAPEPTLSDPFHILLLL